MRQHEEYYASIGGTNNNNNSGMISSSGSPAVELSYEEELRQLSREELIRRVLNLHSTVHHLTTTLCKSEEQQQMQATLSEAATTGLLPINPRPIIRRSRVSSRPRSSPQPAAMTTTTTINTTTTTNSSPVLQQKTRYDISLSVMVINNGSVVVVPLASVLDKTGKRDQEALEALELAQAREADTPVVASRFLRDTASMETAHYSAGGGWGGQQTRGNSVQFVRGSEGSNWGVNENGTSAANNNAELHVPPLPLQPLAKNQRDDVYSNGKHSNLTSQTYHSHTNSNVTTLCSLTPHSQTSNGNNNNMVHSSHNNNNNNSCGRRGSLQVTEELMVDYNNNNNNNNAGYQNHFHSQVHHDRDDDDEPSPKRPSHYHDPSTNEEHAAALSRGAGMPPHLLYESTHRRFRRASASPPGLGGLSPRDISLDSNAMVSVNTLHSFFHRFRSSQGRRSGGGRMRRCGTAAVQTPVSSFATAIYLYIVKTFAVQNGCQHDPNDVEGFGRTLLTLCGDVQRILKSEPRHGHMTSPCYVFGDLHGNFRDLFYFMDNLISFQDLRYTPHKFMFLGDYVDRGEFSVEVVAYLFAMKALAPDKILLLRGNHEDTLVSGDVQGYGNTSFRAQCHSLFGVTLGEEVWGRVSQVFMYLPLTANIDGAIFCTHGGIPRYDGRGEDNRLEQLMREDFPPMESFFEVPEQESSDHAELRRLGMDACWADPADDESNLDAHGFGDNPRGTGVILFGNAAVDTFLDRYGFQYIFRAHQEKADGLKLSKNARVFTIFSTSSYAGHQNGAGVVLVANGKIRLIVKNADPDYDEEDDDGTIMVDEELLEEEEENREQQQHHHRSRSTSYEQQRQHQARS